VEQRRAPRLTYIANHAEDSVVIVDDSLVGALARQLPRFGTVQHVIVAGPEAGAADLEALRTGGRQVHLYDDLLDAAEDTFDWPVVDELDAAAMCYTSGTTGNPKGVVYSHRSSYLHSMAVGLGIVGGLTWTDRVLPIVPMFHANSWGLAYAAVMTGASLVMPDRWLQAEPLCRFMQESRPTVSGAVPTVWNDVLSHLDKHQDVELASHLRLVLCGGSAVPVALQKALGERHGIQMVQAWGMTETSPVASVARPPVGVEGDDVWAYRAGQGRILPGIEGRVVGESGDELPRDGESVGEIEVRGTASMNVHASGSCHFATDSARNARSSAGSTVAPSRRTTDANGLSVHFSSGIPTTAASSTSGWAISAFSSSTEEIHSPPDLITSFDRSVSPKYPRPSRVPTSPVRSQPSRNLSGSSSL
jgi:fatty-acyl-CoA synthase